MEKSDCDLLEKIREILSRRGEDRCSIYYRADLRIDGKVYENCAIQGHLLDFISRLMAPDTYPQVRFFTRFTAWDDERMVADTKKVELIRWYAPKDAPMKWLKRWKRWVCHRSNSLISGN
ncbi:hypothetical protein GCM10007416_31490 [Kroppenstedtia guangzhouensis]|uniref:Uncharacterized protein n=1 Tax=Kroppenstedtia guangzhouensis TaxID=1274356 RepID=A0ABQ1H314_9BACL|nr:hypothetical protein [Kroppenstedtia guangzhouensis]GGA55992.1 hypothetical protein GCM10007416_31490 [Kroppenstedtia guangzhouensis]